MDRRGGGVPAKGERNHVNEFDALREAGIYGRVKRHKAVRADVVGNDPQMIGGPVGTHLRRNRVCQVENDERNEEGQHPTLELVELTFRNVSDRERPAELPPQQDRQ